MTSRILLHVAACATALMLFPANGGAQTAATSFDDLRGVLQDGDELAVTGSDGRRTWGKLVTVTPASVDIEVETCRFLLWCHGASQSFSVTAVTTVARIDSPGEGRAIGFIAGFASFALWACSRDYSGESAGCEDFLLYFGPLAGLLGGHIGGLIDWKFNATVYRSNTPAIGGVTLSLSPLLTLRATGALLNLRF